MDVDELPREVDIIGALAGHLTAALPAARIEIDAPIEGGRGETIDLLVREGDALVPVDITRRSFFVEAVSM